MTPRITADNNVSFSSGDRADEKETKKAATGKEMNRYLKFLNCLLITATLVFLNSAQISKATDEGNAKTEEPSPKEANKGSETSEPTTPLPDMVFDPESLTIELPPMDPLEVLEGEGESSTSDAGGISEESETCKSCLRKLMDSRWSLRQKCLADGGDDTSCDGQNIGENCCGCKESPDADPQCWQNCDFECLWSIEGCANECGWGEDTQDTEATESQ